jgi:phage terminase large subunit-like protein
MLCYEKFTADSIAQSDENFRKLLLANLETLTSEDLLVLARSWRFWRRDTQMPPPGEWRAWLFLGGRGAGKTRAGAEWVAEHVRGRRARRVALLGATHADVRQVMIEGESGLLAVSEGAQYEPSLRRVRWPGTGARATVLSADEPDSIRGHQFDLAWGDEFCKWPEPQKALDMLRMALRLGHEPKLMITTTPRPIAPLLDLRTSPDCATTVSPTRDNHQLPDVFLDSMMAAYRGTRLGRQEVDAEIIEDLEGALWKRDTLERLRVKSAPLCSRTVIGVDPPASNAGVCGIVVAGMAEDGTAYVMGDWSREGMGPFGWANRVADAYEESSADCVVAEANQGGNMVESTMLGVHPNLNVKRVYAKRGKKARAEPIAALYEQGRVKHAGLFPELEDQMCQYDGHGKSPDRLDALVWALTELFPQQRRAIPKVRAPV